MSVRSTFLAICLEGGERMEAVSMKADMRLQARSLACRPVGEHRTMVMVVVMTMTMKMMMKNGKQKDKRKQGKKDKTMSNPDPFTNSK